MASNQSDPWRAARESNLTITVLQTVPFAKTDAAHILRSAA